MKKIFSYWCVLLLIVVGVCSCGSSPEYGKIIPKDAFFVMSLNIQDAVERCELGEATVLKEQIDKSLSHAKLPQVTREQLQEIMEDPRKTGIDFSEPVIFFSAESFPKRFGLVGAVADQDDLEDFFQVLYKEGVCTPVLETDGLRYTQVKDLVFAFNQEWFFATDLRGKQTADVLEEIRSLEKLPVEQTLQSSEVFEDLLTRPGFMHTLYLGSGIDLLADEMHLSEAKRQQLFPKELNLEEFGFVFDFDLQKGEARLVSEMLPLSGKAEQWLDEKTAPFSEPVEGTLVNYLSEDALCWGYTRLDGKMILQQLKQYPGWVEFEQSEPASARWVEELVGGFNGDCAFQLGTEFTQAGIPEFSLYAETQNETWLKLLETVEDNQVKKIDDRTYIWNMPDPQYLAYDQVMTGSPQVPTVATAVMGAKRGISYLLFGKTPGMLEPVLHPVVLNSAYSSYVHLNAERLLDLEFVKQKLGPIAFLPYKKVVGLFDYADCYVEKGRKVTLRMVMKNKEQSPVKTLYDEVEKILQFLG